MLTRTTRRRQPARRGAILIVVLAMLALFAIVGLSFVLYADAQANSNRGQKIAINIDNPPDPFAAVQQFVPVLLYDTQDTGDDLMNPMRGHSLGRSKNGYQFGVPSLSAYSGSGTVNENIVAGRIPGVAVPLNRTQIVNFTYNPTAGYVIDPERRSETPTPIPFRTLATIGTPPNAAAGGNYVSKAAPYTYPDRNNFFLALMDPATGQIVTPSYHRSDLFLNTAFGTPAEQIAQSLNPNNPKWTSPEGRLMTIRPRVAEHPNFPQVPPNADGTYSGDVSNLRYITGSQKNDSLWTDFGGPVLEWRGRKYKALIAPLILDLNSRLNLSVAGNIRLGDTNPANIGGMNPDTYIPGHPNHTSNQGWGPWEVNPTALFPNPPALGTPNYELLALLRQRFPQPTAFPGTLQGAIPQPDSLYGAADGRLGHLAQPLGGGGPLLSLVSAPTSLTDPDGLSTLRPTAIDPMTLPPATGFGPFPTYPARYPNTQTAFIGANSSLKNHPQMYNPFQWKRGGPTAPGYSTHPFGNDDAIKWMTRYTDSKNRYTNTDLYRDTQATIAANGWASNNNLATPFVHASTTTFSSSQHWAELPVAIGPNQFVNLGPIDLNRPLADYRKTAVWLNPGPGPGLPRYEPVPHSPINLWNPNLPSPSPEPVHYAKARQARQNLARDIFVRTVALAGLVTGDPTTGLVYDQTTGYFAPVDFATSLPAVQNLFPALRQYAQLAANIVDTIDPDDVSTAFVWNPVNSGYRALYIDGVTQIVDPATTLTIQDPSADPLNYATTQIGNRVVYGTELPRLVINEAYSSIHNQRDDPFTMMRASQPLKRRYWIELHNPLPTDNAGVLSDAGAARLQYETAVTQLQNPANPAATIPATVTYNPYRVEVAVVPTGMGVQTPYSTFLALNPTNAVADTATAPGMTLQARINTYTQDTNAPPTPPAPTLVGDAKNVILPANGAASGTVQGNQGYYLIGPRDQFPATGVLNSLSLSDAAAGVPTAAAPVNALSFDSTPGAPTGGDITSKRDESSVVILRRLVNPYLFPQENPTLPNYNPYVTTDYIEYLPTRDRATNDSAGMHAPPMGDDTAATIGRKHPYTAFPTYGSNIPHPTIMGALLDGVQNQVAGMGVTPPHTFFGANTPLDNGNPTYSSRTVGLEWLAHMDRQLVNNLELFHVSTQSPALLTQKFFSDRYDPSNLVAGVPQPFNPRQCDYQRHTSWDGPINNATTNPIPALRSNGFHRLLDLLVCGNPMPGVPVGGREPGKMNPNTMNNVRLLNAVLDPQAGNSFSTGAYAANPTINEPISGLPLWNGLVGTPTSAYARTPNGSPRATFAESGVAGGDRPFYGFAGSTDLQDTLLRQNVAGTAGVPVFHNYAAGAVHPYVQGEPLRKMMNSLTPTSDSFLVVMTVGFFEVENAGPYSVTNQPRLGKELFDRVPGDLRAQYSAIVDRSQLAVDHDATTGAISANVASTRLPVQMKLLRDATAGANQIVIEAGPGGTLYDNGVPLTLATGRLLRLGNADAYTALVSGANTTVSGDGEWVKILSVAPLRGPDATGAIPPGASPNPYDIPGHYVVTLDNTYTPAGAPMGWVPGVVNRTHSAGAKVGTVVLGNPGPQTGLTLELLRTRGLVPYLTRIDP